jgi:murein DD-endopeptidase MepM/ murein hydrolase activator NlpD
MSFDKEPRQFGQRKEVNSIVISSNGRVREYKVHAGLLASIGAIFSMFMVGYIASTAYLAFRDDLVAAAFIHQARMKHEYEDRIAALRSRVDRITSRQLLDQQAVEARVAALMQQQDMLSGRSGELQGLIDRANENGLGLEVPVPKKNPQKAELRTNDTANGVDTTTTASISLANDPDFASASTFLRGSSVGDDTGQLLALNMGALQPEIAATEGVFDNVLEQINRIENQQRLKVLALNSAAHDKTDRLVAVLGDLKIALPDELQENIGGPYEPDGQMSFDDLTDDLGTALDTLGTLRKKINGLPLANPLPGAAISSTYGNRVDPFHKSSAFHAGIDFKASPGTPVHATGMGTVIKAGSNGGYGLMVEIDHGNGLTTRYAHLSRISVNVGDKVSTGQVVGKVGSTGRSTGPHLHYEVRRYDQANNPARFLKAGLKISQLL